MSAVVRRTARRRWALVAVVAALLVGTPAVVSAWPAPTPTGADGDPAVLRERVAGSADVAWSGTAESRGALSLPSIGVLSDVTTLLAGVTRLRAWYAAPDRSRTDLLSAVGERDRYVTPDGQAVWDYGANLLTLVGDDPRVRLPRPDDVLPPQLARRLLAGTDPDDPAVALPPRWVAGVATAGLRVRPGDRDTTVEALDVWADPATGLPLRVDVHARGAGSLDGPDGGGPPALSTAFSSVALGPPDAGVLVPHRAPGAGLARSPTSDLFGVLGRGPGRLPATLDGRARERPERRFAALGQYGTTLSQVIVAPLPPDIAGTLLAGIGRTGARLEVPAGAEGALLDSGLLTLAVVREGDRAWALSGLVAPGVLERGAADLVDGGAS